MIEQATRRADDHVDAAAKGVLLRSHSDAAEHGRPGDWRVHGQVGEVFENLRGELARRRQHERARGAARLPDEVMQDRKQKRDGFPTSGHRARKQIASFERRRNGVALDRRRLMKPEIAQPLQETRVDLQLREWHPDHRTARLKPRCRRSR